MPIPIALLLSNAGSVAKVTILVATVTAVVWLYKDRQYQAIENQRQTENMQQLRHADSLRFTSLVLNAEEIKDHLQYQNKELRDKLIKEGVNLNRIESIISQTLKYRDTTKRETDLSGLVESIKNNVSASQEVIDSSNCMTIKGIVTYKNNKLKLTITDKQFKNKSDAVAYWERRQWKFLGMKTRFLGKKVITAKSFDDCGESKTLKIEKKKED